MITDIASYLRFFDSVRRRTERDIAALPPEPAAWRPPDGKRETGWTIEMIDTPGSLSGWRILIMMLEHEVHHRSQIDTFAGVEGWPVPDIFERSARRLAPCSPPRRRRSPPLVPVARSHKEGTPIGLAYFCCVTI